MAYRSTKTFGHDLGLSACFRQWRADSHCCKVHGYALSFKFEFEAKVRDKNGWVVDFGALAELRRKLNAVFDHKLLVAQDDPHGHRFLELHEHGIADVIVLPGGVGCEAFAKIGWDYAHQVLTLDRVERGVRVLSCECAEHGANSAIYLGEE